MTSFPAAWACPACGAASVRVLADAEGIVGWCRMCGHVHAASPRTMAVAGTTEAALARSVRREMLRARELVATSARLRAELAAVCDRSRQLRGEQSDRLSAMEFEPLLRRLLDARGLSQAALADMLAISRAGIARLATGQRPPSAEMCRRIAQALDLTPTERHALNMAAARAKGYEI